MMIRPCVLSFAVVVACTSARPARAQAVSSNSATVAVATQTASASATDPAPHMKVQVLSRNNQETTYAVIFGKGDEVMGGLTEFAQRNHLAASRITGIGGIDDATLGFFDRPRKMHRPMIVKQPAEVLSLLGDIALYQGKPVVHLHIVLGFADGTAHGGHLLEAHVWPTMEVIVTEYPHAMHKTLDAESGAALIDPSKTP